MKKQGFKVDADKLAGLIASEYKDMTTIPYLDETEVPIGDINGYRISFSIVRNEDEDDGIKDEFICVTPD